MMRKTPVLLSALVVLVLVAGAAALSLGRREPAPAPAPVPRPVVTETVDETRRAGRSIPGVIRARIEVDLGFQTIGRVLSRQVDVGDRVQEGQVLAAIDPDDLHGNVTAAHAAVEAALVQLNTAQATAERARELARRNVVSTAQLEQAENALSSAEAGYSQAQSELIRARDAEGYANMTAPFDGVITAAHLNAGAVVSAGQPVLRLSADDELEAVIDLPEAAVAEIRPGDGFQVWSDGDPETVVQAHVRTIEPMADAATRTRRVRLSLTGESRFRLGALIRARPVTGGQDGLTIPIDALADPDGTPFVWIVRETGGQRRVTPQPVTTRGPEIAGRIAVTGGLAPGDEIVTRGVNSLSDGQPVGISVRP